MTSAVPAVPESLTDDDAMDSSMEGAKPESTPGNDVLLDGAVAANTVPIGGRKRPRQSEEANAPKRCRLESGSGDFQVPNLSFLFKEADQSNGLVTCAASPDAFRSMPGATAESRDVPDSSHFQGRPLFFSPPSASLSRPAEAGFQESSVAMEGDEMSETTEECVKPRSSVSCPRLYDRYPGSLEFGHRGVAKANPPSFGPPGDDGAAARRNHCFLSSSNHYNNNSPSHRNRHASGSASSGWTEHCSSVLHEQDYCANYSQLLGDEMFQNIHGC